MHRDRSGSASHGRHSHQSHSSGRSSHHSKEHGRRHHRESKKEKIDHLVFEDSNNEAEAADSHGGGGFEMGFVSSSRGMEEESSEWFPSSILQTTPPAPPTYLSPLAPSKAEHGK